MEESFKIPLAKHFKKSFCLRFEVVFNRSIEGADFLFSRTVGTIKNVLHGLKNLGM